MKITNPFAKRLSPQQGRIEMNTTEKDLRGRLRDIDNAFRAYRLEEKTIETALAAIVAERLKGKYFRLKSYNEGKFAKILERDVEHENVFKCLIVDMGARYQEQEIFVRFDWLSVGELDASETADEIAEGCFLNARDRVLGLMIEKISGIRDGSSYSGEMILRERKQP